MVTCVQVSGTGLLLYSEQKESKGKLKVKIKGEENYILANINLENPGTADRIRLKTMNFSCDLGLYVDIAPGELYRTSIISIAPAYVIVNSSSWTVIVRQYSEQSHTIRVDPGMNRPFWSAPATVEALFMVTKKFLPIFQ